MCTELHVDIYDSAIVLCSCFLHFYEEEERLKVKEAMDSFLIWCVQVCIKLYIRLLLSCSV